MKPSRKSPDAARPQSRQCRSRPGVALLLPLLFFFPSSALATWSIILIDTRTGEVAIGSATCLTNFDLQANTPVLLTGIGGATAQSFVDSAGTNRVYIRDQFLLGTAPADILTGLSMRDPGHQTRQYGIADTRPGGLSRAATFSGTGDGQWAGGQTGLIPGGGSTGGDILYAIQGNVLTGPGVVADAVAAVANTPGDLPAKLMAAMEAARAQGGDGRCSCANGQPPCVPPPGFRKSAHIAYMLIARTGDIDGCNGIYATGAAPQGILAYDFDHDGRLDIATANSSGGNITILLNTSLAHRPPTLGDPMPIPMATGPRDLALVDLNHDNIPDLVSANYNANSISIRLGLAAGGFGPPSSIAVAAGPIALAIDDFNHDSNPDIAVANSIAGAVSVLLGAGDGTFGTPAVIPVGTVPLGIAAADIDSDGDVDLAATVSTPAAVVILRNDGAGNFTADAPLAAGNSPSDLVIADLSGDGRPDIAVASTGSNSLFVFTQIAGGGFTTGTLLTGVQPVDVLARDVNGDGITDLIALNRASRSFSVFLGVGGGAFQPGPEYVLGFTPNKMVLADLDGDGDLDAVITTSSSTVIVVENIGGGRFNNGIGCATGNYFMRFNIANQQPADPDPVFTLRTRYNTWRVSLQDHADAALSPVVFSRGILPADGHTTSVMTVVLRDWRSMTIPAPYPAVTVAHAPGSAMSCAIGPVVNNNDGTYSVPLTAGMTAGVNRFTVRIADSLRPVILMPPPALNVVTNADWNHDGVVNSADVFAFLADFFAGNADANADGVTNSQDFFDFLNLLFNP